MPPKNLHEYLMSTPITEWLKSSGLTVYSEIPWFNRMVDLVGSNGEVVIAVEMKKSLCYGLLIQCLPLQAATREVYAAVPCVPTKASMAEFGRYGIGILSVKDGDVSVLLSPNSLYAPSESFAIQVAGLESGGIAGLPTGHASAEFHSEVRHHPRTIGKISWYSIFQHLRSFYSLRRCP
jgi:hypothetical protein